MNIMKYNNGSGKKGKGENVWKIGKKRLIYLNIF